MNLGEDQILQYLQSKKNTSKDFHFQVTQKLKSLSDVELIISKRNCALDYLIFVN
jgi:hypothetical protein